MTSDAVRGEEARARLDALIEELEASVAPLDVGDDESTRRLLETIAEYKTARSDSGIPIASPPSRPDKDIPPEWKLEYAVSVVNSASVLADPPLADPPRDPETALVVVNLIEAIRRLALAHLGRLRGESGWEDEARRAWNTTSSVERLVVSRHDQPPFDALGSILLSVESVADALLNLSGREQEERRRAAVEWARLAEERTKAGTFDAHIASAARGAVLLSEGSVANNPPT